jgi:hypothetical protein
VPDAKQWLTKYYTENYRLKSTNPIKKRRREPKCSIRISSSYLGKRKENSKSTDSKENVTNKSTELVRQDVDDIVHERLSSITL